MRKKRTYLVILVFLLILGAEATYSQALSEEEAKKANNPLANAKAFNLQNYYMPSFYENSDLKGNSMLVRYAMPFNQGKVLVRATLPINTNPSGFDSKGKPTYASGLGDFNFFATYTFSKPTAKTLLGVGPQVVIPTATSSYLGSGKWQVGAAFILFNTSSPVVQWGGLLTYQVSVAGDADRSRTSLVVLQPILMLQAGKGNYLRSSGIWNFNTVTDSYSVPLGVGFGHILKAGKMVLNLFIEPQYTVLHGGTGQPSLQIFSGINMQF